MKLLILLTTLTLSFSSFSCSFKDIQPIVIDRINDVSASEMTVKDLYMSLGRTQISNSTTGGIEKDIFYTHFSYKLVYSNGVEGHMIGYGKVSADNCDIVKFESHLSDKITLN